MNGAKKSACERVDASTPWSPRAAETWQSRTHGLSDLDPDVSSRSTACHTHIFS